MLIQKFKGRLLDLRHKVVLIIWSAKYAAKPIFYLGTYYSKLEGNALYFSLYAGRRKDIFFFVNSSNAEECGKLKTLGIRAVKRGTAKEFFLLQKAQVVFTVGNLVSDFSALPSEKALRVMLWHAIPLKAVGLKNKPVPDPVGNYDYVIATSEFTGKIMKEAFATERTRVIITGQPKTDILFTNDRESARTELKLPEHATVVTYLPTWRHDFSKEEGGDFGKNSKPLLAVTNELSHSKEFIELLEKHNIIFVIKMHPFDDVKQHQLNNERIVSLPPDAVETQRLLCATDILVSDYSGALIDWIALSKPVISFAFDYNDYWKNRGSAAFNYEEEFGNIMVQNVEALCQEINNYLSVPGYKKTQLDQLASRFHDYRDSHASQRIIDFCKKNYAAGQDTDCAHTKISG